MDQVVGGGFGNGSQWQLRGASATIGTISLMMVFIKSFRRRKKHHWLTKAVRGSVMEARRVMACICGRGHEEAPNQQSAKPLGRSQRKID